MAVRHRCHLRWMVAWIAVVLAAMSSACTERPIPHMPTTSPASVSSSMFGGPPSAALKAWQREHGCWLSGVVNPNCGPLASEDGQDPEGNIVNLSGVISDLLPVDYGDGEFTMVAKFGSLSCWNVISFKLQLAEGMWTPSDSAITYNLCVNNMSANAANNWTLDIMNGPCRVDILDDQTVRLSFSGAYVVFRWD